MDFVHKTTGQCSSTCRPTLNTVLNRVSDLSSRVVQRDRASASAWNPSSPIILCADLCRITGICNGPKSPSLGGISGNPRLVTYPHLPVCLVLCCHALSRFVLVQVKSCGSLTSVCQTVSQTCSDTHWVGSVNTKQGEINDVSVCCAVVWIQTTMTHGAFIVLCFLAVCGRLCGRRVNLVMKRLCAPVCCCGL